ncbi:MAG: DIP1984 family protein [Clostridia bacterium]|nr:DIP1984 family protein [Clostridia bacterium]
MKLAQALLERADLQKRVDQMSARLYNNARVQEGEKPAEDPKALLKELENMTARLETLVAQINLTNSRALCDGEPLTVLLAQRDARKGQLQHLRSFLDAASALSDRARQSEIKVISTVNVAALQKELDQRSKALRELDARIQAANWTVELDEQ